MDIRYSKNTERPVAEIVKEHFSLAINKPAGEYDRNLTDIQLYAGDVYKVKHNGSEYTCTAWAEDGEVHIGGESEPFDIYNFAGDIYVKAETDGANTFEVHHEKVKAFDYDVMPKGYPGTKIEMVEIVPEQSVTSTSMNPTACAYKFSVEQGFLSAGVKYALKINETTYTAVAEAIGTDIRVVFGEDDEMFYTDMFTGGNGFDLQVIWNKSHGETITIAVYEEQDVVQPLDPKFVGASGGGATFFTYSENDDIRYIRHYDPVTNELGEKVTREEFLNAFVNGAVYYTGNYSYENNYGYIFMVEAVQFHEEYAFISNDSEHLYTSEYTASSGPQ